MFRLLHESQNQMFAVLASVREMQRESLANQIRNALSGIEFWIKAQKKFHDKSSPEDWATRRKHYLESVHDMCPRLKLSISKVQDWITGENTGLVGKPLLVHMAAVLQHEAPCPQHMLQYANVIHGMIWQAGLAYCEYVHLSKGNFVSCDMYWSWGTLKLIREAVHRQALNDFGGGSAQKGQAHASRER
ncbi:unnamed protein product [Prorocentrum cordatum]|uniref:Uncharacterized protein n=1 Tax=Prorocentrum cordatum TaxID=2364126 RepID=A0ABN9UT45_9DINO|nr:unnamed protein product [Polarella glacialis]